MRFEAPQSAPLVPARLIRRYKRFLADCVLDDGTEVTAHCANPGAMTGLADPGMRIWLQDVADPKRKLRWSWKLAQTDDAFACIDTGLANRLVAEALDEGRIPALAGHDGYRREVAYGTGSRVDFLLSPGGVAPVHVEVKSVTLLRRPGLAEFPDTVTARGTRHLGDLAEVVAAGGQAVLLYLVQRTDADRVGVAADIDPAYAAALVRAQDAGVQILCHAVDMDPIAISVGVQLPFV
ncbi:DNA/RNA nuclease SfsA [Chachezhania sediminis]|uniref:DNA/RNA nuclease SfsA n=1 Tax=Chachezhania sediminis TaxID=2599291 RepID=UPI00131A884B|nr:DNA/RNA nuclease SfsA [Chachezhania sediminis]